MQNERTELENGTAVGGRLERIVSNTPSVTINFPTEDHRDHFLSWLSDGGGEQQYFESSEWHDEEPITRLDYAKAFAAWGYDEERDGQPVVVASC